MISLNVWLCDGCGIAYEVEGFDAQAHRDTNAGHDPVLRPRLWIVRAGGRMVRTLLSWEDEFALRQHVWLNHHCVQMGVGQLYGDDGELQCNGPCHLDFRRDSVPSIMRWLQALGMERATNTFKSLNAFEDDPDGEGAEATDLYRNIALAVNDGPLHDAPLSVNQVRQIIGEIRRQVRSARPFMAALGDRA